MESQYKVCEVKLTYKSKIKASEKILSAENAYKILLSVFDSETIQYKGFLRCLMNKLAVLGVCTYISLEGRLNELFTGYTL